MSLYLYRRLGKAKEFYVWDTELTFAGSVYGTSYGWFMKIRIGCIRTGKQRKWNSNLMTVWLAQESLDWLARCSLAYHHLTSTHTIPEMCGRSGKQYDITSSVCWTHRSFVFFFLPWGVVRLSQLGTSTTIWPIVPVLDDRWMRSSRWNENW
jgi:hypothetical protein